MGDVFKVAFVGRPNVGKSTIFNKIIGSRKSFTFGEPGITRDFVSERVEHLDKEFELLDTGGYIPESGNDLVLLVKRQVLRAIDDADLIVIILDGKEGLLPTDFEIVNLVRESGKRFIIALNKIDAKVAENNIPSVYELGIEKFFHVSGEHGSGVIELMDEIASNVHDKVEERRLDEEIPHRICIAGRPNVGKSTLLNTLLGEERVIVSPHPGTTRDSIDVDIVYSGQRFTFIDTAGIKQKAKSVKAVDKIMSIRSLGSIARSDMTILVLDMDQGVTHQDQQILREIVKEGKGVVVAANKSDLLSEEALDPRILDMEEDLSYASFAPIIPISAEKSYGIEDLLRGVGRVMIEYGKRISTSSINREAERFLYNRTVPGPGKLNRAYYLTQTGSAPPLFTVFVKDPRGIPDSFSRYISNNIRKRFGFSGCPIRIRYRKK